MNAEELKAKQTPLKNRYREDAASAVVHLHSRGTLDPANLVCRVETARGEIAAGLHPAAGGDGSGACSGDMLLDALVACAGVTLTAVATAMNIQLRAASIEAEGVMDFRGTLGVDKATPVGITEIELKFTLDSDAPQEQLDKLLQLTERYCVIYQTLKQSPSMRNALVVGSGA